MEVLGFTFSVGEGKTGVGLDLFGWGHWALSPNH